jgi:hypothetical protein
MTAERVFILYQGEEPGLDELRQLVRVVEREAGVELAGVHIATYQAGAPSEPLAQAIALRLADEGRLGPDPLSRLSTYTVEARAGLRVVAVTWLTESDPWVRRTIPPHMAKLASTGLTRRPGWARLTTEAALGFVAAATDGASRRFADVHIVVSVLPETRPRRVRRLMPGGYLTWVDGVFDRAGVQLGEIDLAHWLLCGGRIVHLAYLAKDRGAMALLPWDLLSRAEKRGGRKLA